MLVFKYETFTEYSEFSHSLTYFVIPKWWKIWQLLPMFFGRKHKIAASVNMAAIKVFSKESDWPVVDFFIGDIELKSWIRDSCSSCVILTVLDHSIVVSPNKYCRIQFFQETDAMAFKLLIS